MNQYEITVSVFMRHMSHIMLRHIYHYFGPNDLKWDKDKKKTLASFLCSCNSHHFVILLGVILPDLSIQPHSGEQDCHALYQDNTEVFSGNNSRLAWGKLSSKYLKSVWSKARVKMPDLMRTFVDAQGVRKDEIRLTKFTFGVTLISFWMHWFT